MQTKVGIREFRENLSSYLESKKPVAITRHGATIGVYVPTREKPGKEVLDAIRVAGEKMQAWMAAEGITEEDIMREIEQSKRAKRKQKI